MEKRAWIRGKERERRPRHGWITSGRRALTFLLDAQQIKAIWFARVPRLLCPRLPDCRLFFLFALSLSLSFFSFTRASLFFCIRFNGARCSTLVVLLIHEAAYLRAYQRDLLPTIRWIFLYTCVRAYVCVYLLILRTRRLKYFREFHSLKINYNIPISFQ